MKPTIRVTWGEPQPEKVTYRCLGCYRVFMDPSVFRNGYCPTCQKILGPTIKSLDG